MAHGAGPYGAVPYGAAGSDEPARRSPHQITPTLDAGTLRRVVKLLTAETNDFNKLVELSGLDPRRDFRHTDLADMTMAGSDLRGFDFSYSNFRNVDVTGALIAGAHFRGADLNGTDLSRARGLSEATLDFAIIQDAPFSSEMVVIPPGQFMMGSPDDDPEASGNEKPQHPVTIAYGLAVGRYPVTFEEFDHFAEATGREPPPDEGWDRGRRPVINVSWEDATAYVDWLSKETGRSYRLLSEAEWEYVCRAGTTTRYACGDEITRESANYGGIVGKTSEVGSYASNPWNLYDMHGNVWEWVEDCWNDSYEGAPDDGSARTTGDCGLRVLRGGSCGFLPRYLRSACRYGDLADERYGYFGFRVARTL